MIFIGNYLNKFDLEKTGGSSGRCAGNNPMEDANATGYPEKLRV